MYHRIQSVTPSGKSTFDAVFCNGEVRRFDVASLMDRWPEFCALRDTPGLFECVHVEPGGYGVSWNDQLDLECEDVWEFGTVPVI